VLMHYATKVCSEVWEQIGVFYASVLESNKQSDTRFTLCTTKNFSGIRRTPE